MIEVREYEVYIDLCMPCVLRTVCLFVIPTVSCLSFYERRKEIYIYFRSSSSSSSSSSGAGHNHQEQYYVSACTSMKNCLVTK